MNRFFSSPDGRGLLSEAAAVLAVFMLLWAYLNPHLGTEFSPDSYNIYLVGRNLVRHGEYTSPSIRNFHSEVRIPQPSSSYPPLWPLVGGIMDVITGAGINALALANGVVLFLTLWLFLRLAKKLAPETWVALFLAFPAFFLLDEEYRIELAAGRAIPLGYAFLFWMLLTLADSLQAETLAPRHSIALGLGAAGLILTRFDQLIYACVLAALCALAWARVFPKATAFRAALLSAATLAAVYLPWAIRNMVAFGSPMASDNSASALSLAGGTYGYSFFAPHNIPGTVFQNFPLWFAQRKGYFLVNLTIVRDQIAPVLPAACLLLGLAWRNFRGPDRWLLAAFALQAACILFTVSLVSAHDPRYFSVIKLELIFVAGLSLARLLSDRRIARLWIATSCAILAWRFLPAGAAALRNGLNPFTALSPQIPPATAFYRRLTPALRGVTGPQAVIATHWGDEFTYYTGMKSIYLPLNCLTRDDNFDAWLKTWHPDYIYAQASWVDQMGLKEWVIPDLKFESGYLLLRVPPSF